MALRGRRTALALAGTAAIVAALAAGGGATASSTSAPPPTTTSSTTTTQPTTTTVVPVLRTDATVTIAVSHIPAELNPWAAGGSDPLVAEIMAQVWPQASIVDLNGDSTVCFAEVPNCPEPLFTSVEDVSVQPQTIDYAIDPKAKWSDGTAITAADFVALWHAAVANAALLPVTDPVAGYLDIASITPSDGGRKFAVVFNAPYADWPALFTDVPPSHISSRYGFAAAFTSRDPSRILSAGPYRISRIVPGKSVVLDRNDAFWGNTPTVKRIIFRVYPNEASILAGLTAGTITLAALAPSRTVQAAVTASDELAMQDVNTPILWQLAFNVASPDLYPAVVREAIAKVINRHEIIADSFGLQTPFGQTSGNRLFPSGAPGSQGNDGAYGAVDLDEATQLLASAGDLTGPNGFVETPGGKRMTLSLEVPAGDPEMSQIGATIQAELLVVGITVSIHTVALATMLDQDLPQGSYDLALVPYPVSPYPTTTASLYLDPIGPTPPPDVNPTASAPTVSTVPVATKGTSTTTSTSTTTTTTTTLASSTAAPPLALPYGASPEPGSLALGTVTRNVLGFSDPALPGLFAEASTELNTAAELSIFDEIDTQLWADMPTLPLFQAPTVLVYRIALLNVSQSSSPSQYLWNAESWAVEKNPTPVTTTTIGP